MYHVRLMHGPCAYKIACTCRATLRGVGCTVLDVGYKGGDMVLHRNLCVVCVKDDVRVRYG